MADKAVVTRCPKCNLTARESRPAEPDVGFMVPVFACEYHGEFFETADSWGFVDGSPYPNIAPQVPAYTGDEATVRCHLGSLLYAHEALDRLLAACSAEVTRLQGEAERLRKEPAFALDLLEERLRTVLAGDALRDALYALMVTRDQLGLDDHTEER